MFLAGKCFCLISLGTGNVSSREMFLFNLSRYGKCFCLISVGTGNVSSREMFLFNLSRYGKCF